MARRVITVRHPDGTTKVIVGKESSYNLVKSRSGNDDNIRRPKPVTPKISISKERNGYKNGGKIKFKAC